MRSPALSLCLILVVAIAGCAGGSPPIALTFPSGSAQAIDNGQSVNITVNGAGTKGVTWSLSGPGSLSNQTLTSVTYNATATGAVLPAKATALGSAIHSASTSAADPTATVTATSVADTSKSAAVTINITPPPAIPTTSLPAGTEGTAYNQTVASSGGAGTLTFTISTGSLPAGLTMDTSGHITGTPTGPNGTATFTVKVSDSSNGGALSSTQNLSILINLPPAPAITTSSLPAGMEGTAYNQTIAATGGLTPYTFTISSATGLPAGLSMDTSGHITGTPTGPNGTSNFTVKLTDKSNPAQSATQNLSITINLPPAPTITTATLPAGVEGAAYSQTIQATGFGTLAYSISAGTLPAGLSLNAGTGAISGTPLGPNTISNFTVTVTDSSNPKQTGSKALSITINLP